MRSAMAMGLGLAATCSAAAWEVDGFRSGMSSTAIEGGAIASQLKKVPLGDRIDAYVLQGGGRWFSVCKGKIFEYSFEIRGGYDEFVRAVEREQIARGRASMFAYSMKSEVLAQWEEGSEIITIGIGRNAVGTGPLSVSKGFSDQSVERPCRKN
jgi:hypothetical protein